MRIGFIAAFLLTCVSVLAVHSGMTVKVEAGKTGRQATPVFVEITWPVANTNTQACVSASNQTLPAQVEFLEDGKARVWWIVENLSAGQSRTYEIQLGESCSDQNFQWTADATHAIDLAFDGRSVLRYMYPTYDPNNVEHTKKPFHHVFAPSGKFALTKGVGGRFSHHRGIFVGYNKVSVKGESYDIWHAHNGEHSQHHEFLSDTQGPIVGSHTLLIQWKDREGNPFIEETRTLRAFRQPDDQWLIEIETTLESLSGEIELNGDRQHAGVQFRAAQEVAEHENTTRYLRPEEWSHLPSDKQINTDEHKDLPWNAIQIDVQNEDFTVAYLTDPANPEGARFSERLYGRFGEFIPYTIDENNPLHLRYRWWVHDGHAVSREDIQQRYTDLANPPKVKIVTMD